MDDKTKNIQPEIENLNLDEIDVEEIGRASCRERVFRAV